MRILKKVFVIFLVFLTQAFMLSAFADDSAVDIPKGEAFSAILQTTIDSDKISRNESISAVIQEDWYYNNILVAPRGSILNGKIVKFRRSGDYLRNGNFSLQFYEIVTPQGILSVTTNIVKVTKGKMRGLKLTGKFLTGMFMGALYSLSEFTFILYPVVAISALIGGFMNLSDRGSEAVLPAGTTMRLRTKKKILNFKPFYRQNTLQTLYVPVLTY